ncbi:MAG: iron uptake porin, partial [Phormidesmis sp.]
MLLGLSLLERVRLGRLKFSFQVLLLLAVYDTGFTPVANASGATDGLDSVEEVSTTTEFEKDATAEAEENITVLEVSNSESKPTGLALDDLDLETVQTASVEIPAVENSVDIAQVTSVSELSDVEPDDWAFTALQRLVEEYGCLEGYPDRTFRGDRAMTRYEFAAGLNACLDVVLQLVSGGDDLSDLDRLQEEFAVELEAVRAQVTDLEANVAELQANQFSTTTKLRGSVFSYLSYATANGDILSERASATNPFAGGRDANGDPIVQSIESDIQP